MATGTFSPTKPYLAYANTNHQPPSPHLRLRRSRSGQKLHHHLPRERRLRHGEDPIRPPSSHHPSQHRDARERDDNDRRQFSAPARARQPAERDSEVERDTAGLLGSLQL